MTMIHDDNADDYNKADDDEDNDSGDDEPLNCKPTLYNNDEIRKYY